VEGEVGPSEKEGSVAEDSEGARVEETVEEETVEEMVEEMEVDVWGIHLAETEAVSDLVGLVGLVGLEARWESAVRVASRGMEGAKAQEESEEVAMAVEGLVARVA